MHCDAKSTKTYVTSVQEMRSKLFGVSEEKQQLRKTLHLYEHMLIWLVLFGGMIMSFLDLVAS